MKIIEQMEMSHKEDGHAPTLTLDPIPRFFGVTNRYYRHRSLLNSRRNASEGHIVSWKNLSVKFGNKVILKKINGLARSGTVTAIMGHSGCGKTTLLKTLAGRFRHTDGEIMFNGVILDPKMMRSQKSVAFVAQTDTLDAISTVRESIEFSALLRLGLRDDAGDREYLKQTVELVIQNVRLEKCSGTQTRYLSGGERRRLSIAIELIAQPSIMILDEPTSGMYVSCETFETKRA